MLIAFQSGNGGTLKSCNCFAAPRATEIAKARYILYEIRAGHHCLTHIAAGTAVTLHRIMHAVAVAQLRALALWPDLRHAKSLLACVRQTFSEVEEEAPLKRPYDFDRDDVVLLYEALPTFIPETDLSRWAACSATFIRFISH